MGKNLKMTTEKCNNRVTDYILINRKNQTLPYGLEYYTMEYYGVLGVEYVGFESIGEAISFIEYINLPFIKQK